MSTFGGSHSVIRSPREARPSRSLAMTDRRGQPSPSEADAVEHCQEASPFALHAGEVAPWREAIQDATSAVGLIELPSTRFIELSSAGRKLVGAGTETGLELFSVSERASAAAVTRAADAGTIDGTEASRRRWHRRDGSVIEVIARARAIRLGRANFGVWTARAVSEPPGDAIDEPSRKDAPSPGWDLASPAHVVATLDERWRVRACSGAPGPVRKLLGVGTAISAVTHPADRADLVFSFAGATSHVEASTRLRLLSRAGPLAVDFSVSRIGEGGWHIAVAPTGQRPGRAGEGRQRVAMLESSLRRIAQELEGSGILPVTAARHDVLGLPGVSDLPERQREIVARLVRGERVSMIASGMYLSPNTVRNHLGLVFRKFGVHSQQELLATLQAGLEDGSSARSS
jgi:DNA-binding CsgD family transcriptional regulator